MKKIICCVVIIMVCLCSALAHAVYTLNVSVCNRADDRPASSIAFPGVDGLVLGGNLWIVSPQYLRIVYGSHATHWSVRIITKNGVPFAGVYPKPLAVGPDTDGDGVPDGDGVWEWERLGVSSYPYVGGVYQTGDDIVTYAGLINPATRNNPNSRAPIAWQVFRYNDPYNPPPPGMVVNPPTALNDGTVGGSFYDDWGYLADAADTGYIADPTHEYFFVAFGSGAFGLLSQHPVVYTWPDGSAKAKPGGGDCVVYLGARFGLKAADGVTDVAVLPAGNYSSVIYLELIHW